MLGKAWKITLLLIVQAVIISCLSLAQDAAINPDGIIIPKDAGLIKAKHEGSSGRIIIHIQDAHCNFEAQSNIVKILENLIKNYKLNLVSVEGADGAIDTSWFKSFPDDEVRKEVATYFMKKGEITGPEFISITTDYPVRLFGAETRSYYIQNMNAFTSSFPLKDATESYFNQIKQALSRLKDYIYSKELKELDAEIMGYEAKNILFNDYVRFLQSMAERHRINLREYENLFKLISVLIYEKKIDFKFTDKERSSLIDELSGLLSKQSLAELVAQSISFKSNKISSAEYYAYLKNLSIKNGIDIAKKYPNLYNYINYNAVYSRIESEKLFKDIEHMETALKEKLFENDDQRMLEKLSRHIDVLIGLVNIRLLNGNFVYYQTHKEEFSYEYFADFVNRKAVQFGLVFNPEPPNESVKKNISRLEEFYAIALKRDKALVDNTLETMARENQKMAVLVTGGFHSEGITKLLEKEGVSYMVVSPTITKDVPTPYLKILTNQKTSVEDLIVETAQAKQGTLAPFLISWANTVGIEKIEKMTLGHVPGMAERVNGVNSEWIEAYVNVWLKNALNYANTHNLAHNKEVMMEAFRLAMRNTLSDLVKQGDPYTNVDINGMIERITTSPAYTGAFDNFFRRLSESVVTYGSAGTTDADKPQGDAVSRAQYIYDTYVRDDIQELQQAIGLAGMDQKMAGAQKPKRAVFLFDTGIDTDARGAIQAGESAITRSLGEAFIEVRGTGEALLKNAKEKIDKLRAEGEDVVIVTIAGTDTLSSTAMTAAENREYLGKILEIDKMGKKGAIRIIGLYALGLRIAYGSEDNIEAILSCLNRIAEKPDGTKFTKDDVKGLFGKDGRIRLAPIMPYDPNEVHEAYMAMMQAEKSP